MSESSRGIDKKLYDNNNLGKGIVTMILPDDKMPKRKCDNRNLDLIFSPNSVIGRLNPGQIYETTINRISEEVFKELTSLEDIDEKKELYLEFMKDLLPERLHDQLKFIEKLKDKKLVSFFEDISKQGFIYIPQVPFEVIEIDKLAKWYNRYGMNDDYITIDGKDTINPILTGHQYILKLKHLPEKKISACNAKKFGSKTLQPAKDNAIKNNKIAIGSNPNTIGEQENSILMALSSDMNILKELIFLKSSDVKNREIMIEKLFDNEEIKLEEFEDMKSIAVRNLNYYLNVIGITLDD